MALDYCIYCICRVAPLFAPSVRKIDPKYSSSLSPPVLYLLAIKAIDYQTCHLCCHGCLYGQLAPGGIWPVAAISNLKGSLYNFRSKSAAPAPAQSAAQAMRRSPRKRSKTEKYSPPPAPAHICKKKKAATMLKPKALVLQESEDLLTTKENDIDDITDLSDKNEMGSDNDLNETDVTSEKSTSDSDETEKEFQNRVEEGKDILSKKKPRREVVDLSHDQMRKVAELLRENDNIYNKESPAYRDTRARIKAQRTIADAIGVSCELNEFQILSKMNRIYKFITHQ